jgi:hypothetical protein
VKLFTPFLILWLSAGIAISPSAHGAKQGGQWEECNWMVTYRGRTYDLAPLTRESLSRPLETDLRLALSKVPQANIHLLSVEKNIRDSNGQARLASAFIMAALLSRIIGSSSPSEDAKQDFRIATVVSIGFFGAAALSSWRSAGRAKAELAEAVESFNRESPQKILPLLEQE